MCPFGLLHDTRNLRFIVDENSTFDQSLVSNDHEAMQKLFSQISFILSRKHLYYICSLSNIAIPSNPQIFLLHTTFPLKRQRCGTNTDVPSFPRHLFQRLDGVLYRRKTQKEAYSPLSALSIAKKIRY